MSEITPFQTVGPFFDFGLQFPGGEAAATDAADGVHIVIEGTMRDGAGDVVTDALLEIWQANAAGRYRHPLDAGRMPLDPGVDGFGRAATTSEGRFEFHTVMPGRVAGPDGSWQSPHLVMSVLARGVLTRLATRVYFEGDPTLVDDPVLALVPEHRRNTLIAKRVQPDRFVFDIVLQGSGETVFFDV